jgi:O-antigen/teichoic acid export membrane protein
MAHQRILLNTLWILILRVVHISYAFFIFLLVARLLGKEQLGIFSYYLSIGMLLGFLCGGGIPWWIFRELSKDPEYTRSYLFHAILLHTGLGALIFAGLGIISFLEVVSPERFLYLLMVAGYYLCSAIRDSLIAIFRARERMGVELLVVGCERFGILFVSILGLVFGQGLEWVFIWHLIMGLGSLGLMVVLVLRETSILDRIDIGVIVRISTGSSPFFLAALATWGAFKIDTVILYNLVGEGPTGLYNAAYSLVTGLLIIPISLGVACFPAFSRLYALKEIPEIRRLLTRSTYLLFLVGLGLTVWVISFSRPLVIFLYGNEFRDSGSVLQLLIWAAFMIFIRYNAHQLLYAAKYEWMALWITLLGMIVNLVLDLLLIPYLGIFGAVWSTLASGFVEVCLCFYSVSRRLCSISTEFPLLKPVLSCVGMIICIHFLEGIHWIPQASLSLFVWVGLLVLTRSVCKGDFELLTPAGTSGCR